MSKSKRLKTDPQSEAQKVIDAVHPGFQEPLRIAHGWVIEGAEWVPAAIRVLEDLRTKHPHALKVRAELVLAYLQDGRREQAEQELSCVERDFPVDEDEETLCRFGRLRRDVGDDWVKGDDPTDEQFRMADREYELAWRLYDRAFKIRKGHYPGMNRASLYLLRAWAARSADIRDTLIRQAKKAAAELLARLDQWPHENPEDDIWHLASAAEGQLLLEKWPVALENYRSAIAHELAGAFHQESIGKQVRRLLRPLGEVGNLPKKTAAQLMTLFPLLP
jgi:hypothetical protein